MQPLFSATRLKFTFVPMNCLGTPLYQFRPKLAGLPKVVGTARLAASRGN